MRKRGEKTVIAPVAIHFYNLAGNRWRNMCDASFTLAFSGAHASLAQVEAQVRLEGCSGLYLGCADGSPVGGGAWSSVAGGPRSSVNRGFNASAHT